MANLNYKYTFGKEPNLKSKFWFCKKRWWLYDHDGAHDAIGWTFLYNGKEYRVVLIADSTSRSEAATELRKTRNTRHA